MNYSLSALGFIIFLYSLSFTNSQETSLAPKHTLLNDCLHFQCQEFIKTANYTSLQNDSWILNTCQSQHIECAQQINQSTEQATANTQYCYNRCYHRNDYSSDTFKAFLGCSWKCAQNVYGIDNHFDHIKWNNFDSIVVSLFIMTFIVVILLLIQKKQTMQQRNNKNN